MALIFFQIEKNLLENIFNYFQNYPLEIRIKTFNIKKLNYKIFKKINY